VEFIIAAIDDSENAGEQDQKNEVESEERSQINEYLHQHRNQKRETVNNSQEEECLDEQDNRN